MGAGVDGLVGPHAEQWGRVPVGVWRAPGRVNLVGEHTDYNQGFVLPFAIAESVHVAASSRSDRVLGVSSREFGIVEVDVVSAVPRTDWARYPEAALRTLEASGVSVGGLDLTIESAVPVGAGLSSRHCSVPCCSPPPASPVSTWSPKRWPCLPNAPRASGLVSRWE